MGGLREENKRLQGEQIRDGGRTSGASAALRLGFGEMDMDTEVATYTAPDCPHYAEETILFQINRAISTCSHPLKPRNS